MSAPTHEELVNATLEYLPAYIGKGVSVDPIVRDLEPRINIEGLSELLEYNFLMTGEELSPNTTWRKNDTPDAMQTGGIRDRTGTPIGILDFVSLLPLRIRSLDPATHQQLNIFDSEVRGRIDWGETIKQRYRTGDPQNRQYACHVRQRTIQTDENRVLIELIQVIKRIYERFSANVSGDSSESLGWFEPWENEGPSRQIVESQLENVYLSKISHDNIRVDTRDLRDVQNSRNPLYREAAILLDNYRRISQGDLREEEIKGLLRMKPFSPSDDREGKSVLFELYWIFMLLEQFENPEFKQITSDRGQLVAEWSDSEYRYLLFNDWKGKVKGQDGHPLSYIDISWGPDELNDALKNEYPDYFMRRRQTILEREHDISHDVFDLEYGPKTPDIVLLKLSNKPGTPKLHSIFIGEVKHSTSKDYIKKGLRQLLEYGAHAKFGDYLQPAEGPPRKFICESSDFIGTSSLELGYFVGDASMVKGKSPNGIQICGFGEMPRCPLCDTT